MEDPLIDGALIPKTLFLLFDGLGAIGFGGRELNPFIDLRCNRFGVDD